MAPVLLIPFHIADVNQLLPPLRHQLGRSLGVTLEVAEAQFDIDACYSSARGQYEANKLLTSLGEQAGGRRVVGLTDLDLFISIFTFVLGAGLLGGLAAVVSTRRLRPETYGLPPDPAILEERVAKEVVHELGHTFGLRHCHDPGCVMHASSVADEVDVKGAEFRGPCLQRLQEARKNL